MDPTLVTVLAVLGGVSALASSVGGLFFAYRASQLAYRSAETSAHNTALVEKTHEDIQTLHVQMDGNLSKMVALAEAVQAAKSLAEGISQGIAQQISAQHTTDAAVRAVVAERVSGAGSIVEAIHDQTAQLVASKPAEDVPPPLTVPAGTAAGIAAKAGTPAADNAIVGVVTANDEVIPIAVRPTKPVDEDAKT